MLQLLACIMILDIWEGKILISIITCVNDLIVVLINNTLKLVQTESEGTRLLMLPNTLTLHE